MKTDSFLPFRRSVALCALAFALPALAHEFWLEPSAYRPEIGQRVEIRVRVGEHFNGNPVARAPERIERFAAVWGEHEALVSGKAGDEPAGTFIASSSGLCAVVYDSDHVRIELDGTKFTSYLEEKGLDQILKQRAEQGTSSASAVEIYSRCVKSLLDVEGNAELMTHASIDRPVGMPLEIVAEFNPYASKEVPGATFRVLYFDAPLEGIRITAQSKRGGSVQAQHTDAEGRITFNLSDAGPWLIEGTHMRATPELDDVDYESFWSSLTFELAR